MSFSDVEKVALGIEKVDILSLGDPGNHEKSIVIRSISWKSSFLLRDAFLCVLFFEKITKWDFEFSYRKKKVFYEKKYKNFFRPWRHKWNSPDNLG